MFTLPNALLQEKRVRSGGIRDREEVGEIQKRGRSLGEVKNAFK